MVIVPLPLFIKVILIDWFVVDSNANSIIKIQSDLICNYTLYYIIRYYIIRQRSGITNTFGVFWNLKTRLTFKHFDRYINVDN